MHVSMDGIRQRPIGPEQTGKFSFAQSVAGPFLLGSFWSGIQNKALYLVGPSCTLNPTAAITAHDFHWFIIDGGARSIEANIFMCIHRVKFCVHPSAMNARKHFSSFLHAVIEILQAIAAVQRDAFGKVGGGERHRNKLQSFCKFAKSLRRFAATPAEVPADLQNCVVIRIVGKYGDEDEPVAGLCVPKLRV